MLGQMNDQNKSLNIDVRERILQGIADSNMTVWKSSAVDE